LGDVYATRNGDIVRVLVASRARARDWAVEARGSNVGVEAVNVKRLV
jgi:hypothetical protein